MKKIVLALLFILGPAALMAQTCSGIWGNPIVNQTFGQGVTGTLYYTPLATYAPGATTSTIFTTGYISDGYSILTQNVINGASANWINKTDHTGNANGLMFLINAPSTANTVFFEYTMSNLCPNTTLQVSLWMVNANVASLESQSGYQYPNMAISVVDPVTNAQLATTNSGNVPPDGNWHNYTLVFSNGNNTSVKLKLTNFSVGTGFGNDLAIDDIVVRPCIPNTTISPKVDTVICGNATIPFNANVAGNPYSPAEYQWQYSTNSGATWVNAQPASASPAFNYNITSTIPGTYWLRFLVGPTGSSSNSNCSATSDTSIITVSPKPPAPVINAVTAYCPGEAFVPFTTTATGVKWYNTATGGIGSTTAPTVNTATPGTYTFYATQTNTIGCESETRTPVIVTVYPFVTPAYTYNIKYGCTQDTVEFTNNSTSTGNIFYAWDFGDNTGTTDKNPVHVFNRQNVYTVKLYTSGDHCKDSLIQQIDLNHPLVASFTIDDDTICQNTIINFTNTSTTTTKNSIVPTYFWDFGDGSTDNTAAPIHTYTQSGVFRAMLAVTDFVPCSDTAWQTIVVDSTSPVAFTTSDTLLCEGKDILFTASYLTNGLQGFTWNFGDGTIVSGNNPAHHSYDQSGQFTVQFTTDYRACKDDTLNQNVVIKPFPVLNIGPDTSLCPGSAPIAIGDLYNSGNQTWVWSTGATTPRILVDQPGIYSATVTQNGCSTSDELEVFKSCYLDIPNIFSPNGDGLNDYFFPRNLLSRELRVFKMQIYNRWGQIIFETVKNDGRGWDGKFNSTDQPQGAYVYLIEATFANGVSEKQQGTVTLIR